MKVLFVWRIRYLLAESMACSLMLHLGMER
jgi:hypothetical protein